MKIKIFLYAAVLFLMAGYCFAGHYDNPHYVDCSIGGTGGSGTYAAPWRSMQDLASQSFSTSDDLFFKDNTTCTVSNNSYVLDIDWAGTSGDRAVIGCYSGDGVFTCTTKPIIDGQRTNGASPGTSGYPTIETGLVKSGSGSYGASPVEYDYVTIENLNVKNSSQYGISIKNGDNIIISNVETSNSGRFGIGLAQSSDSEISDCTVSDTYDYTSNGDAIDLTALGVAGQSQNNVITRNTVSKCNECIGIYKKNDNTEVSYNVVYDVKGPAIYVDASNDTTIKYNMVYQTTDGVRGTTGSGQGIFLQNENARGYAYTDGAEIYGNMINAFQYGFYINHQWCCDGDGEVDGCYDSESERDCGWENVNFTNNTLIANTSSIRILGDDEFWLTNRIYNNISWIYNSAWLHIHANNESPDGFTWGYNNWYSMSPATDTVSGDAAGNAITTDPAITKSSGWRSNTGGSLDGSEFGIDSDSTIRGDAYELGTVYDYRITAADMDTPGSISVTIADQADPDIGAWQYDSEEPPPASDSHTGLDLIGISFD